MFVSVYVCVRVRVRVRVRALTCVCLLLCSYDFFPFSSLRLGLACCPSVYLESSLHSMDFACVYFHVPSLQAQPLHALVSWE
jgi:hypothetical protein